MLKRIVVWMLCCGGTGLGINAVSADEYYSEDIFTAITEAKVRTHHYDYSNALRYNRSTSQSIQIPRLLVQEMEQTSIKTPELSAVEGQGSVTQIDVPTLGSVSNEQPRPSMANSSASTNLVSTANHQNVSIRAYINN